LHSFLYFFRYTSHTHHACLFIPRRVGCGECDYVFCRDCLQGAHLGPCLPCGGLAAPGEEGGGVTAFTAGDPRAARATWLGADPSSVTIRVISKPCPNCRSVHLVSCSPSFSFSFFFPFFSAFFLVLLCPRPRSCLSISFLSFRPNFLTCL
jgi:hypothetical protein